MALVTKVEVDCKWVEAGDDCTTIGSEGTFRTPTVETMLAVSGAGLAVDTKADTSTFLCGNVRYEGTAFSNDDELSICEPLSVFVLLFGP